MENGFGGILAFDVGDTQEHAKKFVESLKKIINAVSLGCTETLLCLPVLTIMLYIYMPLERGTSFGVKLNTVRMSAGIENIEIILNDLERALQKI
jgi:cystathionine beta-lyase/cystathionine gamma-synthase